MLLKLLPMARRLLAPMLAPMPINPVNLNLTEGAMVTVKRDRMIITVVTEADMEEEAVVAVGMVMIEACPVVVIEMEVAALHLRKSKLRLPLASILVTYSSMSRPLILNGSSSLMARLSQVLLLRMLEA
jgi:hypothetical protein